MESKTEWHEEESRIGYTTLKLKTKDYDTSQFKNPQNWMEELKNKLIKMEQKIIYSNQLNHNHSISFIACYDPETEDDYSHYIIR